MTDTTLTVIDGPTVAEMLAGRERDVVDAVAAAYVAHGAGASALPHSVFLRFPDAPRDRVIALPAFLGDEWNVAGIKWIASFPGNVDAGLDRASAVLVLSSAQTGYPFAVLEGSLISAQRTAASAALAARYLWTPRPGSRVAVVGCGLIGHEMLRYVHNTVHPLEHVVVFDLSESRADAFVERCRADMPETTFTVAPSMEEALGGADLILFATTAGTPHVSARELFAPGATVLHVSLRDLAPELVVAFDNVVDDVDHVCRAETSIHLAERLTGGRAFIRTTLADIVRGASPARRAPSDVVVFSPFGLGVLDLAVGHMVTRAATAAGRGTRVPGFLPEPWRQQPAPSLAAKS